jgi:cyclophilin family peptidyl-prolyl cis-trans isomerase
MDTRVAESFVVRCASVRKRESMPPVAFRACITFALAAFLALAARAQVPASPGAAKLPPGLYAEFTTPRGVFVTELFYTKTPMTCASFVGLAEGSIAPRDGKPFYTGLRWYRVVPGFVIQSGDPTTPVGGINDRPPRKEEDEKAGHPYSFPDEFVPGLRHDEVGMLSMANSGPDTNSSEFFLTLAPTNRLNYLHSVFGRVVRGLEVLPKIEANDAFSIKIVRVGAAAQAFKTDEASFKARVAAAKKYPGEPLPSPTANFDDPDQLIPTEPPRAKNFNFKLANFERTTGVRIVARLYSKSPSQAEDEKPGAYMKALAEKFGVARHGALAAYFADEKDWRVWIGDESTATFAGRPMSAKELQPEDVFHKVKTDFLERAEAQGNADFEKQKKNAAADKQPLPAQRLKLQVDAMLDGLILKLEPKSKP